MAQHTETPQQEQNDILDPIKIKIELNDRNKAIGNMITLLKKYSTTDVKEQRELINLTISILQSAAVSPVTIHCLLEPVFKAVFDKTVEITMPEKEIHENEYHFLITPMMMIHPLQDMMI